MHVVPRLVVLSVILLCLGFVISSSPPVAASTTVHTVYVSSPGNGKILKVVATETGRKSVSVLFPKRGSRIPTGFAPKAMTFGPDGNLWVVSGNQIFKVDPDSGDLSHCHTFPTGGGDPHTIGDIRFLGDIPYFTTEKGVYRFNRPRACGALEWVNRQGLGDPAGIFFEVKGKMLFVDGAGKLYRDGPPFDSPSQISRDLKRPLAVGTRGSHGFLETGKTDDTYVSHFGEIKVFKCPASGACTRNSTIPFRGDDSPRDFEVNLAGELLVATLAPAPGPDGDDDVFDGVVDSDAVPVRHAKLWLVKPGRPVQRILLVDFSKESRATNIQSIWGVAIPPTSYSMTLTFSGEERFNCGNSLVDLSFDGVSTRATVECKLALPARVNNAFAGDALDAGASCVQYDTSNGFCTLVDVDPDELADEQLLFSYVRKAEPLAAAPLVVRNFNEITITDYYLQGDLDPDDAGRKSKRSSVNVVADGEPLDDPAEFDGFTPEFGDSCEDPIIVKGNGAIPIRAEFSQACDDSQVLRLSIVCDIGESSGVLPIDVMSAGNANMENYFRCAGDKWIYNLSTKESNIPKKSCCAISAWGSVGTAAQGFFERK